jgi:hypothetical protein
MISECHWYFCLYPILIRPFVNDLHRVSERNWSRVDLLFSVVLLGTITIRSRRTVQNASLCCLSILFGNVTKPLLVVKISSLVDGKARSTSTISILKAIRRMSPLVGVLILRSWGMWTVWPYDQPACDYYFIEHLSSCFLSQGIISLTMSVFFCSNRMFRL